MLFYNDCFAAFISLFQERISHNSIVKLANLFFRLCYTYIVCYRFLYLTITRQKMFQETFLSSSLLIFSKESSLSVKYVFCNIVANYSGSLLNQKKLRHQRNKRKAQPVAPRLSIKLICTSSEVNSSFTSLK